MYILFTEISYQKIVYEVKSLICFKFVNSNSHYSKNSNKMHLNVIERKNRELHAWEKGNPIVFSITILTDVTKQRTLFLIIHRDASFS